MVFLLDGPRRTGWERSGDGGDGPGERKVPKISGSGAPGWGRLVLGEATNMVGC
jgi:hypothetical protein